jgi:hypothetical protein
MNETIDVQARPSRECDLSGLGVILRLPEDAERAPDLETESIRFYGALGVMKSAGGIELGICVYKRRPLLVDRLEQHRLSAELLLAVDDDFVVPVAPDSRRQGGPDLSRLVALRVVRGEGVVLTKGVWHGVPYPLKEESFALVGFNVGTAQNDLSFHDLDTRIRILL